MKDTQLPESVDLLKRLEQAWQTAHRQLHSEIVSEGGDHWVGQLSTSSLSTATAISALSLLRTEQLQESFQKAPNAAVKDEGCFADVQDVIEDSIRDGCVWLEANQNDDGGFGDTTLSHSNIATTLLVLAAWELAGFTESAGTKADQAWQYVDRNDRWKGLRARYGRDKTFAVPILSNCALAGFVPWSQVPTLPFEAAWLPQDWYRWAQMPVVSYAIPALVAIGQARFHFSPPANPLLRALRKRAQRPTLEVLRKMQPASGGYLEAVPLTSFVVMSLSAAGNASLPVVRDGLRFLLDSRLPDGSWPIDTNLATWITSLSISSLASRSGSIAVDKTTDANQLARRIGISHDTISVETVRWLLRCQHTARHPFTGATPGGWGWSDLSGAVPDADDTPAALLALSKVLLDDSELASIRNEVLVAVGGGLRWLYRLQNRNGGWPTFCRGWGKLPFDRSGSDLTAHALRAIRAWLPQIAQTSDANSAKVPTANQLQGSIDRGFKFLNRAQRSDGSWVPLWFGNQDRVDEDNPIYGTGKVLLAFAAHDRLDSVQAKSGVTYLVANQNDDGGWGGGRSTVYRRLAKCPVGSELIKESDSGEIHSTIEETAVTLESLIQCGGDPATNPSIMRGLRWLADVIEEGNLHNASPIGFYFAKLWYFERLYPTVFSLGAIGAALRSMNETSSRQVS